MEIHNKAPGTMHTTCTEGRKEVSEDTKKAYSSDRGATMVEYVFLVTLMSIGLIGVVSTMRMMVGLKFQAAAQAIETGGGSVFPE